MYFIHMGRSMMLVCNRERVRITMVRLRQRNRQIQTRHYGGSVDSCLLGVMSLEGEKAKKEQEKQQEKENK